MPKKTKKQKIIADYRRKIKLLTVTSLSSSPANLITSKTVEPIKIEQSPKLNQTVDHEETVIRKYFFQDLKKSFVLIGLMITLEIIFYFVSIKNYFGLG